MQTNRCISDEQLASWHSLTADEVANVNAHVAGCESCRVVLAEVSRTTGERPPLATLGRYVLQEKVGAGGMGTVWAAWDPSVGRRVALKLLHEASSDGHRAQRFLHERQVLAGLEHPNIARLLDAGETGEGRPWFVMDFVDGQPIDQYCDAKRLTVRQRLELFLPMMSAVAYAHQHLVVHRDLKPGNILVGGDGTPHLVDFGIARLLEGSAGLTQTGMTPMTPAFASPEQVRREPVATTSDVYSLGVVLYELLTGVSPYKGRMDDLEHLLTAIREAEPEAPSLALARSTDVAMASRATTRDRLRRELAARDLDAIVLMALRKEPRDRYASVEAMADDLRAALAGLPTVARRGNAVYRAARFVRRHKVAVSALAAGFLALAAGLVATLWQARRAERERDLAERRFEQVRALAHKVIFDYHDGMAELPGSTPLRERVVKDAHAYLDTLAKDAQGNLSLERELALAFFKLGDAQGDPNNASLGHLDEARASYLRGREVAEAMLKTKPGDADGRRLLASSYYRMGAVIAANEGPAQAFAEYERARALQEPLAREHPDSVDDQRMFLETEHAIATTLLEQGDPAAASLRNERTAAAFRKLLEAHPRDDRARVGLGMVLTSLVRSRSEQGRLPDALVAGEEGDRVWSALVAEQPQAPTYRRGLTHTWRQLAAVYRLTGDFARSGELSRKVAAEGREAVAKDPKNAVARLELVVRLSELATNLGDDPSVAAERSKAELESISLLRELVKGDPARLDYQDGLIELLTSNGLGATGRGELDLAKQRFDDALALVPGLPKKGAKTMEWIATAHYGLAAVFSERKQHEQALREMELAVAEYEQLLAQNPKLALVRNWWAMGVASIGELRVSLAEQAPPAKRKEAWEAAKAALVHAQDVIAGVERDGTVTDNLAESKKATAELLAKCEKAQASR